MVKLLIFGSKVEQILLTRQVKYEAHQTTHVGHAKQLIHLNFGKQKAENIKDQVVLVVGGDGTLNETFNALKHEAPLEVLPCVHPCRP